MTAFASTPIRSQSAPADGDAERASETCNIGPGELRRRRDAAMAMVGAMGAALLAIATELIPPWTAPYLAPLAGAVAITVLQVRMRFCVAFGLAGLVGMGERPGATPAESALRAAHRRRAALMVAAASGVTLAWVVVAAWLVLTPG